jgi:cellulose biosynthesis protein BcsQ
VRTIKVLLFDAELRKYFLEKGLNITNDTDDFDVLIANAQKVEALEVDQDTKVFIQLTGKPSDMLARKKYPNVVFFKDPEEIIEQLKPTPVQDIKPITGDSFLGLSYSNKGGVGKTTSAISLAYCLSEMGYKTVIADFDFKGPNLASYFNIKKPINYLKEGVSESTLNKALTKIKPNFYALPMSSDIHLPTITSEDLQYVCDYLQERFECVIIDTMIAPHENSYMWDIFKRANLVYAITNQAKITMEEMSMYAPSLIFMGVAPHNIRILINQYSPKQTSIKQVVKAFNKNIKSTTAMPKLAGQFPHNWDEQLKALSEGKYLNKEEWQKVCREIPDYLNKKPKPKVEVEKTGLLTKLKIITNRA